MSPAVATSDGPTARGSIPAAGTPVRLREQLAAICGSDGVLARASDLARYAPDASPYRLIPEAVVQPRNEEQVAALMRWAAAEPGRSIGFRAGGTSLSGQAQSSGVLVDIRRHFGGLEVLEDGAALRIRSGTILGHGNHLLAPHGRRLGPDPASKNVATLGGVLANNSGGMRCGTTQDTYSTLRSLRCVLPSGTVVDTSDPDAAEKLERDEPELCDGLRRIRAEIRADLGLSRMIERKFEIKNTMGYRLCAFLDADEPVEILQRLLVGSEGTLAFVSEATLETVPEPALTTLAWIPFPTVEEAVAPVRALVDIGATAVELMVGEGLAAAAERIEGLPAEWSTLPEGSAALLVEFGGSDLDELAVQEAAADAMLEPQRVIGELIDWARDPETQHRFWRVREGLHGTVGDLRPDGTALIVEDVCVPPERLAECTHDVRALLAEFGFMTHVSGHASAGNLHFWLTPDFADQADRDRYERFMTELVGLIAGKYGGSLKAEHGTGLNMAPFIELEWGPDLARIMWRIKQLFDPAGILAPGVMLNRDPRCHLENLKVWPRVHASVDRCVECGICEPVCPSRNLTLTPRQRIVLEREIAAQPAGSQLREQLESEFSYDGEQTCAADGLCAVACPIEIDTGDLIKHRRAAEIGPRKQRVALEKAKRWDLVERAARLSLRAGAAADRGIRGGIGRPLEWVRGRIDPDLIPGWPDEMPHPAPGELPRTEFPGAEYVYLPSCMNRIFGSGPAPDGSPRAATANTAVALARRAGVAIWVPPDAAGACCGLPMASKGYGDAHDWISNRTIERIWTWSSGGRLPVVIDASSCTQAMLSPEGLAEHNRNRLGQLEILDSTEWIERAILPRLKLSRKLDSVALHPGCSATEIGLRPALERVAAAIAEELVVPRSAGCCGFAGDRGLHHPELTAAALAEESAELEAAGCDSHIVTNRTCEIGLCRETGQAWTSLLHELERLSRPAADSAGS